MKEVYTVVINIIIPVILTALLTALLTYITTVRKERVQQVNKHCLEILQKLYTPIYRVLYSSVFPGDGYM